MRADEPRSRGPAFAVAATFFLLGFIGASWIACIPAMQSALGLDSAALGVALLGLPVGSVMVSLALPRALHVSTRGVLRLALPAAAASLVLMPLARSTATLAAALVVFGVTTGAVDVAMNAHAVHVQRSFPGSLFSRWHAMWSLGGFAGAGVGGVVAAAGVSPLRHLAAVAVVAGVGGVVGVGPRLAADAEPSEPAATTWSADRKVLILGAIACAAFMVEVGAADWVGVFVHTVVGATTGLAAGAFAAFALPHFVVRLGGDVLIDRIARRRLLAGGLLLASAGFVVLATSAVALQALAGMALAGAGIALVVPVAFAAAGSVPGVAAGAGVSTAAGLSYVGWAVTPPLIGAVAATADLRVALLVPCAAAVAAATLTRATRAV